MVRLDRKCGISLYFIYGIFDFVFVLLLYTSFFTNHEQLKRWKIETTDYRVIVVDFVLIAGARLACVFAFLACSCLCASQRFFFVVMRLVVVFTATISGVYSFAKLLAAADLVPAHTLTKTFWGLFAWNLVSSVIFGLAFYYFVDKPLERPLKRTIKTSPRLKDPKLLQDDIDEKDSAEELRHSNSVVDYVSLPYSGSQPDTAAKIEELLGYARTVKRLLSYAKREFCLYICGFFFVLVYVGAYTLIPYYIGSVIGDIVVSKNYDKLLVSVAIMGGLNFAAAISAGLIEGILRYANAKVNVRIRGDLFGSFLSQEIGFFDTTKTGDITSRLTADTQQMSDAIGTNLDIFLRNCLLCFGSLGFMFGLCWQLTLLNFIALPLYGLATQLYGRWYESLQRGVQDSLAYVNELADEILSSMRTVRSFANEQNEVDAYTGRLQLMLGFKLRQSVSFIGHIWTAQLFDTALMVAVLWYGGHLVFKEQLDSRGLIQFLLYQIQIGQCLLSMGRVYTGLMAAVGASRKVFSHIDRKPQIDYNGKVKLPSFSGKIELRDVTFAYPTRPNLPVIRNMSISIEPGEVVALVGPSGGGKSSVIALLEHFYEPIAGSIAIDSVPLGKFDHKFLHNRMALVSQEPTLYARSVADNIRYGFDLQESDEQSLARVVDVAKLANAHDFVSALPLGYSTETGEKGVQLSGGQKQRIAIARALIRDPKILLLDEATSALDAESEYLVQQAIHRNMGGRTVILIAHRLSTVEQADRIIVINAGRVVQQGSHTSLLAQEGMYRSLVQRQLLATGDDADNTLPPLPAPSTGGDSMSRRTTPADWDENNFYSARSNRSYASSTEHEDHVGLV